MITDNLLSRIHVKINCRLYQLFLTVTELLSFENIIETRANHIWAYFSHLSSLESFHDSMKQRAVVFDVFF